MNKRLSKTLIDGLKPEARRYLVWDQVQSGLVLRVEPTGAKRFYAYVRDGKGAIKRPKLADYDPASTDQLKDVRESVRVLLDGFAETEREEAREAKGDAEKDLLIATAFSRALAETNRNEDSIRAWNRDQRAFEEWLGKRYPSLTKWGDITRRVLKSYLNDKFEGRSANRKRLALQPVVQTAGYMEREHQVPNVTGRLGLGNKLVKTPATVFMRDVVEFLIWLKVHDPVLEVGAGLAGLAGLQLQEALRLSWSRVDLKRGLIEVSGEVKNEYRERVIPVPAMLKEILQRAHDRRSAGKVQDLDGPVVPSPLGYFFSEGTDSWRNYSKRLVTAIREFNPRLDWTPKDLRNNLMTLAAKEEFGGVLLEQYVGHVAKGVTARHYIARLTAASAGERDELDEAMQVFKDAIVRRVDAAVEKALAKIKDNAREGARVLDATAGAEVAEGVAK